MIHRRSRAQALVLLTLALPMFVSIAGLAIDGGVVLMARGELQSVADGAARAGATRLDKNRLRASGGSDVQLDQSLAAAAANAYVDQRGAREFTWQTQPVAQVEVTSRRVHVLIDATAQTAFLRIMHIDTVHVSASAFADVESGIRDATGT
jgi:uncharacterized membrane protein